MKTSRVPLCQWHSELDSVEVDWPHVQRTLGYDCVRWLLTQDHTHCQLIVDRRDHEHTLIAEFYNTATEQEYFLLWS